MTKNRLGWIIIAVVAAVVTTGPVAQRSDIRADDRVVVRVAMVAARGSRTPDSFEVREREAPDSPANRYARRYGISPRLARIIWREARAQQIDPEIVFGLIAAESKFDPRAIGREGERGLMQIKLETARAYQRGVTADELMQPETNLRLGLLHLKREVEHFGHDWTLGLLAYNMGRGRLTRALQGGRMPQTEYAARVLSHLRQQPL
jgi:soluble lytic murein transglycosylase-like protein